jgi:hypothetical protein
MSRDNNAVPLKPPLCGRIRKKAGKMINGKTEICIEGKTAIQIYDWIVNLNEDRYLHWHPDHQNYEERNKSGNYLGTIVYYGQEIEGSGTKLE